MIPNFLQHAVIAASIAMCSLSAHADMPATGEQAGASTSEEPSIFGQRTDLTVGVGISYAARYPGAAIGQVVPVPVLAVQRGVLFADTLRGIGLQYQSTSAFYISESIYYDFGRLDRDNRWRPGSGRLAGMGDVPSSATSRTIVAQQLTPLLLASAETETALRDNARRNRFRVGVELTPLKTDLDTVTVDLDAWWGDGRYNGTYFGVTPPQAGRTAYPVFSPGAGLYALVPGVSLEHHLDGHWACTLQLTGTHYTAKVAGSPLVAKRTASSASVAIAYTY
jgi:outer membrane protein